MDALLVHPLVVEMRDVTSPTPIPVAAVKGVGVQQLARWDCGFEIGRRRGCLSLVNVCCQVALRQVDPSSGVLPSVVCLSVIRCNSNPLHLQ